MEKKYRLLENDTITISGRTLYRIEALRDFADAKKGDKGGYVESEENLSHEGTCWVYDDACVYGKAWVYDNARVFGDARVYGNAKVSGDALVSCDARVYGNACVYGNALLYGKAEIRKGKVTSGVIYK